MFKRQKNTLEALIKQNKEELLNNKMEIDRIEKRIEERHQTKIRRSLSAAEK